MRLVTRACSFSRSCAAFSMSAGLPNCHAREPHSRVFFRGKQMVWGEGRAAAMMKEQGGCEPKTDPLIEIELICELCLLCHGIGHRCVLVLTRADSSSGPRAVLALRWVLDGGWGGRLLLMLLLLRRGRRRRSRVLGLGITVRLSVGKLRRQLHHCALGVVESGLELADAGLQVLHLSGGRRRRARGGGGSVF